MCKLFIYGLLDKRPIVLSLCHWLRKTGEVLVITDNPMYFKVGENSRYIDDVHFVYSLTGELDEDVNCYNIKEYDYIVYDFFYVLGDVNSEYVVCINNADTSDINAEKILEINYGFDFENKYKSNMTIKPDINHYRLVSEIMMTDKLLQFNHKDVINVAATIINLMMPNLKTKLIYEDIRKDV